MPWGTLPHIHHECTHEVLKFILKLNLKHIKKTKLIILESKWRCQDKGQCHNAKGKQTRVSSTEQNSTTEKQRTFSLQLRGKKVLFMVEVKKMRLL